MRYTKEEVRNYRAQQKLSDAMLRITQQWVVLWQHSVKSKHPEEMLNGLEVEIRDIAALEWGESTEVFFDRADLYVLIKNGDRITGFGGKEVA